MLSEDVGNKEAYKIVGEPLVYSALNGFNGILMCYGQTGTGVFSFLTIRSQITRRY